MSKSTVEGLISLNSKRTLASFYLAVAIEIATRRDTSCSSNEKAVLKFLELMYSGLKESWETLYVNETPEDFLVSYTDDFLTIKTFRRLQVTLGIKRSIRNFAKDIFGALKHETKLLKDEKEIFSAIKARAEIRIEKIPAFV